MLSTACHPRKKEKIGSTTGSDFLANLARDLRMGKASNIKHQFNVNTTAVHAANTQNRAHSRKRFDESIANRCTNSRTAMSYVGWRKDL